MMLSCAPSGKRMNATFFVSGYYAQSPGVGVGAVCARSRFVSRCCAGPNACPLCLRFNQPAESRSDAWSWPLGRIRTCPPRFARHVLKRFRKQPF